MKETMRRQYGRAYALTPNPSPKMGEGLFSPQKLGGRVAGISLGLFSPQKLGGRVAGISLGLFSPQKLGGRVERKQYMGSRRYASIIRLAEGAGVLP